MKKFFSFIIRQSVAIVLIVLLVLGLGIYSALKMSVNLLPDINVPMVCVQVIYPGANADSVERDVTGGLEDNLSSLGGVTSVDSYSYDNLSAVVLSFDYGTDTDKKKSDIQSRLSAMTLPDGVSTSVYDIDLNGEALAVLSVTSEKGLDEAYAKGSELALRLAAIDGVESVEIKGGAEWSYYVRAYGGFELIVPLIVEAFSYGGLDLPLGSIGDDGVQIRNNSDIASESDITDMPIQLPGEFCAALNNIRAQIKQGLQESILHLDIDENFPVNAQTVVNTPLYFNSVVAQVRAAEGGEKLSEEAIKFIILNQFSQGGGEVTEKTVRISDVATVGKEASYSSYAYYFDGKVEVTPGVAIEIYKSNGANSSAVVKQVKSVYRSLASEQGYTASINLLDDQSEFISDSISNVLISMLIGGVLAVLVIYIFLKKVRTSAIIAVTMPLSVLAAIICLFLSGVTLNMVSLGGLAVGIGMLVDNSIVVIESISKHRDMDKSAFQAAVDGTAEVGGALFGSTLTTVCVFIPIIFTGGLTAEIFTDLSLAVIFSLAFSLIVAVTVIPALYALICRDRRMLKGGGLSAPTDKTAEAEPPAEIRASAQTQTAETQKPRGIKKLAVLKQPVIMDKVAAGYGKVLPKILSHKLITILSAVVIFGASVGLLFLTGTEFLPSVDKGQIEVDMTFADGTKLDEVEKEVLEFSRKISREVDGVDFLSVSVGKNGLLALKDSGIIDIQMKSGKNTDRAVKAIRALADQRQTGGVTVRKVDGVVASLMSGSDDLSVTIVGGDKDTLAEIAGKLRQKLKDGGFTDITDSATSKSLQYTMRFDRAALAARGLDYYTVVMTLRIGIASHTACSVTIGGENFNLNVAFAEDAIQNKTELENFTIGYYNGAPVRLSDVLEGGHITEEYVDSCIRRVDGQNMVSVSAALPGEDTGTAGRRMKAAAREVLKEYEGYSFEQSGISSYLNDAFEGLAVALVISFFLLYGVMAVQFGSALKPLIIMASIPFCFTGGFLALVITRTSLNVVSFIGLIMLMGVVVNNAIVMLEKIKQLHDGGMPHFEAVVEACKVRLRPILMTTLTTVLALIPLAIGVGSGSELMQPLGIVVIGGLLLGTLVTLAMTPAVYCAVHGISPKNPEGRKGKNKEKPASESAENPVPVQE